MNGVFSVSVGELNVTSACKFFLLYLVRRFHGVLDASRVGIDAPMQLMKLEGFFLILIERSEALFGGRYAARKMS